MDNKIRIIAGSLKNRIIKIPKNTDTRPALALVRRVICDTLTPYIPDSSVLDLFAGTGAFVFEMLSRGAESAVAVDINPAMTRSIEYNAKTFGLTSSLSVLNLDYLDAIERLALNGRKFDIIFIPPPFYGDYVDKALDAIEAKSILKPDGIAIAHYYKKDDVKKERRGLELWKTKTHGKSVMDFFRAKP